MPIRFTTCVLWILALALAGCGPSAAPASGGAKHADALAASLDAEDALLRLLVLIRDRPELRDVDREVLQHAFGVRFTSGDDAVDALEGLRYEGPAAKDWRVSIVLSRPGTEEATFELAFSPEPQDAPGPPPPATAICALDFDRFAAELRDMGLLHDALRGELSLSLKDMFRRPGQRVTVLSRGENNEAPAQITHACVRRVLIE